jgi:hypothetical protein
MESPDLKPARDHANYLTFAYDCQVFWTGDMQHRVSVGTEIGNLPYRRLSLWQAVGDDYIWMRMEHQTAGLGMLASLSDPAVYKAGMEFGRYINSLYRPGASPKAGLTQEYKL